jgi:hypothetical protein
MKKVVVLLVLTFSISSIFAQELVSKKGEQFLPKQGDWAISMCADPIFNFVGNMFNGNTSNGSPTASWLNGNQTIVGKKFIADDQAYRAILRLGFVNQTFKNFVDDNTVTTAPTFPDAFPQVTDKLKITNMNIGIGVGKEFRKGVNRLQGFYGADVMLWVSSSSAKLTYGNEMSDTTIAASGVTTTPTSTTWSPTGAVLAVSPLAVRTLSAKSGMTIGFGIRGFIGAEYFIFPKIAIGAEYGWGLGLQMAGKGKQTTQTVGGAATEVGETTVETAGSTSFGVDTDLNQGFIFGFKGSNTGTASLRVTLHF